MAAPDNPSNAVEWAMAEMVNKPEILRKAMEEIDRVVGKERLVQESDIPKLNYVKAILREAFRLHPVAAFNLPHVALSDTRRHPVGPHAHRAARSSFQRIRLPEAGTRLSGPHTLPAGVRAGARRRNEPDALRTAGGARQGRHQGLGYPARVRRDARRARASDHERASTRQTVHLRAPGRARAARQDAET